MRSLPRGCPLTLQLLSMDGDILEHVNSTVINMQELWNLTTLKLVNMNVQVVHASAFSALQKLASLTISKNKNVDLQPGAFLDLGGLYFLDLSENGLKNLSSGVFQGLEGLRHLILRHNTIKTLFVGLKWNGGCGESRTQRTLDLSGNGVNDGELDRIACFTDVAIDFDQWRLSIPPTAWRRVRISRIGHGAQLTGLYQVTHLHISASDIPLLPLDFFFNSQLLRKLGVVRSKVRYMQLGCFQGLHSLLQLDLSRNLLRSLNDSMFQELVSLKRLDISRNPLKEIQEDAFRGLKRLRFLDLSGNRLNFLGSNTFSHLISLRDLLLNSNYIRRIHPNAFSGLPSLKSLELPYTQKKGSTDVALMTLQRLDNFEGPGYFACEGVQITRTLILIGADSLIPAYIEKCLKQITYVRDPVSLYIFYLSDLELLSLLNGFHISSLQIEDTKVSVFKNNSFRALSELKSLTIVSNVGLIIERGAFNNLKSLEHLHLVSSKGLQLETWLFSELISLQDLIIERHAHFQGHEFIPSPDLFRGLGRLRRLKISGMEAFRLAAGNLVQLEELEALDFSANNISLVRAGMFRGLRSVQSLDLSLNEISSIGAGVFGAVCGSNFTLSCLNLTHLSEFCDASTALASLRHLDLSWNGIEFIDPQAFLGCKELLILHLKQNRIQALEFLYIPRLSVLNVENNNFTIVSNTSFKCTSELTDIDFRDTVVKDLQVSSFQYLRNIKTIGLPKTKCDCQFRTIWQWLRSRRVKYTACSVHDCKVCNGTTLDVLLPTLACNSSVNHKSQSRDSLPSISDLAYFRKYIEPMVFAFIFVCGCFGNGLLLFIVFRYPDMRNRNNACIAHLAIADILSLILNLALSYWDLLNIDWDLGETACKLFIMCKDLIVTLVVYSVLALTLERFLVVRMSFQLKAVCGLKNVGPTLMLATIWIYAIASSSLSYMGATVNGKCLWRDDYIQKTRTYQLWMDSLVPVFTICVLNIVSAYMLKKSIDIAPGELRNQTRYKNRNTVANIITIMSLVFMLSYVPNSVLRTLVSWSVWDANRVFWYAFITFCLFFFHAIFNPFAVFVMGSKYRTHISKFFNSEKKTNLGLNLTLRIPCNSLIKSLTIKREQNAQISAFPDDVHVQDVEVRRARQERLNRLQQRML
ncbi:hypothetical protein C0J52_17580 [Blattella germanica]|nr:hypothetical protein C0J52_17580 [Blattella germanica]